MGKLDTAIYSVVLLLCLILGAGAYHYDHHTNHARDGGSAYFPLFRINRSETSRQLSHAATDKHDASNIIRVTIEPSPVSTRDVVVFCLSILGGIATVAGIVISTITLRYLRKQTGEIHSQRITMQDTLEAMNRQARIMAGQSEHLKDTVDLSFKGWISAEKNLKAMKDKERGRLGIEIRDIDFAVPRVHYTLSCYGTTPAYIVDSWHNVSVTPVDDYPWTIEEFGTKIYGLLAVIPPGNIEDYFFISGAGSLLDPDKTISDQIKRGDLFIHFRLWIEYVDVFEEPHTLYISKVYGSRGHIPLHSMLTGLFGNIQLTPEWRESKYKYSKVE